MQIPQTSQELFDFFLKERDDSAHLRDEMNQYMVEKRVSLIKDQRIFLQNIALSSATLLGLTSAFTSFSGVEKVILVYLFSGLALHLSVISLVILHIRESLDLDSSGLVSMQDRYGKIIGVKIKLAEEYQDYALATQNEDAVKEILKKYFKKLSTDPSIEELKKENIKLDIEREARLSGNDALMFYGELIGFCFILGSAFILLAILGIWLDWHFLSTGILLVFLLCFTNSLSLFLNLFFRFMTFAQKDIKVLFFEVIRKKIKPPTIKFILHGGYTREDNELNRGFYEELVKDVPDGGTVLFCYFASTDGKIDERFQEAMEVIRAHSHGKTFQWSIATEEGFIEEVKKADALYIGGGDTRKLLEILKKYPDFKEVVQGKTVAGSSAGAYALVRYGSAHTEEKMREGLGLVPVRVICHYESPLLPPSKSSVAELHATAPELELILLRDYEWKVFTL